MSCPSALDRAVKDSALFIRKLQKSFITKSSHLFRCPYHFNSLKTGAGKPRLLRWREVIVGCGIPHPNVFKSQFSGAASDRVPSVSLLPYKKRICYELLSSLWCTDKKLISSLSFSACSLESQAMILPAEARICLLPLIIVASPYVELLSLMTSII